MMHVLWLLFHLAFGCLLTVLTQVGGVAYLAGLLSQRRIKALKIHGAWKKALPVVVFAGSYALFSWVLTPPLARLGGRVPLPWTETAGVRPLHIATCLLNRNYVRPVLRDEVMAVAARMHHRYPGTIVNYLDANFPFFDGFPLLPHLSHHDGRKLDLSFCYKDASTGTLSREAPSWNGYGICEVPRPGEPDMPAACERRGFGHYSMMQALVNQEAAIPLAFDEGRTREMIAFLAARPAVSRIFVEPHLRVRLGLQSPKIRFHGCQAVRHDDHIHVEVQ